MRRILIGIAVFVVMVLLFAFYIEINNDVNNSSTDVSAIPAETTTKQKAPQINLQLLKTLLDSNIVAAEDEFEGNLYTFKIRVSEIHSNSVTATVYETNESGYLACKNISVSLDRSDIKPLMKGDELTIEGYVSISQSWYSENVFEITRAYVVKE